jgi:hypothetical protein
VIDFPSLALLFGAGVLVGIGAAAFALTLAALGEDEARATSSAPLLPDVNVRPPGPMHAIDDTLMTWKSKDGVK